MVENTFERLRKLKSRIQLRMFIQILLEIGIISLFLYIGITNCKGLTFYPLLYFVPIVAIFFDIYVMIEYCILRRIGSILRKHAKRRFIIGHELNVAHDKGRFFIFGSWVFSLLSIPAAFILVPITKGKMTDNESIWFISSFIFLILVIHIGNQRLRKLGRPK
jgi:hypothetical protein